VSGQVTQPHLDLKAPPPLPAGGLRLHVNLDLLVLDAWSIFLFFSEWATLYHTPGASLPSLGSIAAADRYDVVAHHDDRNPASWFSSDAILRQLNAIRTSLGQSVKPIYLQEPMPFANYDARPVAQGGCGNQQHDSAPGHARSSAQSAKRHGAAAWTFHTRQSFNLGAASLKAILSLPAHASQKAELEAVRGAVDAPGVTWGVTSPTR